MRTEERNLGIESVLEQWDTVGESGHGSKTTETPESQVSAVCLGSSEVDVRLGNLVGWSSDILSWLVSRKKSKNCFDKGSEPSCLYEVSH